MPKCKRRSPQLKYIQNIGHNWGEVFKFVQLAKGRNYADLFFAVHTIFKGDYIVQDEYGDFFVYDAQTFHKIFERVND